MRIASALWHAVTPLPQYGHDLVAERREPRPQGVGGRGTGRRARGCRRSAG